VCSCVKCCIETCEVLRSLEQKDLYNSVELFRMLISLIECCRVLHSVVEFNQVCKVCIVFE